MGVGKIKKGKLTRAELRKVLLQAAAEGNALITDFIFSSLKATGKTDIIKKLMLHKDSDEKTAWDIAAYKGNEEILEKLWCWGREVQVNHKDNLLLSKGNYGETAWIIAALEGNKEILEKLWCW
jgi:ankyrin repeat protein